MGWAGLGWGEQGEVGLTPRAMLDGTSWNCHGSWEGQEMEAKLASPGLGPWGPIGCFPRRRQRPARISRSTSPGKQGHEASQREEEAWPTTSLASPARSMALLRRHRGSSLAPLCALGCDLSKPSLPVCPWGAVVTTH